MDEKKGSGREGGLERGRRRIRRIMARGEKEKLTKRDREDRGGGESIIPAFKSLEANSSQCSSLARSFLALSSLFPLGRLSCALSFSILFARVPAGEDGSLPVALPLLPSFPLCLLLPVRFYPLGSAS